MPINMNCPSCSKLLAAPDTAAGKRAKCPSCGQIMIVPEVVHDAEEFGSPPLEPSTPFSPLPSASPTGSWLDEMQDPAVESTPPGAGAEARRPCPECGEMIMVGAAKCRFCNAIFDPRLKLKAARNAYGVSDSDLTTGDWILCILCSGIGCIMGIVYTMQGKPKGWKMIAISFATGIVWSVIRAATMNPQHFR